MLKRRKQRQEFEEIAIPHLSALYGGAYRLTRNPRDAEDLVQDTLLRAYRFWDSFERDSNIKAWLFRILTNTFINTYQKNKRGREVLAQANSEQKATDGVLVHERQLAQRDPEGLLIERSMSDDVSRALAEVPADFRTAVVLCDIEGFSYREISEIMNCPVGTVMSRLHRGRRLLREALHDFAVAEGILKPEQPEAQVEAADHPAPEATMVKLDDYRRAR